VGGGGRLTVPRWGDSLWGGTFGGGTIYFAGGDPPKGPAVDEWLGRGRTKWGRCFRGFGNKIFRHFYKKRTADVGRGTYVHGQKTELPGFGNWKKKIELLWVEKKRGGGQVSFIFFFAKPLRLGFRLVVLDISTKDVLEGILREVAFEEF